MLSKTSYSKSIVRNSVMLKMVIIITILVIAFMQDIYNYIPKTNHVSRVYSVAAVLYLQFVLHVMLICMLNMFYTFTLLLSIIIIILTITNLL
jgi:hypothetical protein